jgi:hypothetical protein
VKKFCKALQSTNNPVRNKGVHKINPNAAIGLSSLELFFHLTTEDMITPKLPKQNPNPTNIATTTEFNYSGPLKKS